MAWVVHGLLTKNLSLLTTTEYKPKAGLHHQNQIEVPNKSVIVTMVDSTSSLVLFYQIPAFEMQAWSQVGKDSCPVQEVELPTSTQQNQFDQSHLSLDMLELTLQEG